MWQRLQRNLEDFRESEPGQRFGDRYRRRREDEKGHVLLRVFNIGLGLVISVASLVLAPLPGPGFLTVFLGLAIVAGELLYAARFLDWCELRLRELGRFVRRVWRSGVLAKVLVVIVVAILAAAFLYAAYYFLLA